MSYQFTFITQVPRPLSSTPQTPSNISFPQDVSQLSTHDTEAILSMLGTFSSLYSSQTIGVMAVTGLVSTTQLEFLVIL